MNWTMNKEVALSACLALLSAAPARAVMNGRGQDIFPVTGVFQSSVSVAGTGVTGSDALFRVAGDTFSVNNDGNAGIGTAAPGAKLEVKGAGGGELVRLADSSDNVGLYMGSAAPEGAVTAQLGSIYFNHSSGKSFMKASGDGTNAGWAEVLTSSTAQVARMSRQAAQSIDNANQNIKVLFDTEDFDAGGIADAVTNDRFDITADGLYLVTACWGLDGSALDDAQYLKVMIAVGGSPNFVAFARADVSGYPAQGTGVCVSDTLDLDAGNYIEMFVGHTGSAAVDTSTNVSRYPRMSVTRLK